jgi:hypothetical protein
MAHLLNRVAPALLGVSFLNGCYTTTNVVTVAPLRTQYPVSASPQYVDGDGEIVTEEHYDVVQSFQFEKRVEAPIHDDTGTTLQLEADLDRILAEHHGDALTQVSIVGTDYDRGSHTGAANWKIMGWTFGLSGAAVAGLGLAVDEEEPRTALLTVGGVFVGIGVVSYLMSGVTNDPAAWNLQVKGNVVKRTNGSTTSVAATAQEDGE